MKRREPRSVHRSPKKNRKKKEQIDRFIARPTSRNRISHLFLLSNDAIALSYSVHEAYTYVNITATPFSLNRGHPLRSVNEQLSVTIRELLSGRKISIVFRHSVENKQTGCILFGFIVLPISRKIQNSSGCSMYQPFYNRGKKKKQKKCTKSFNLSRVSRNNLGT